MTRFLSHSRAFVAIATLILVLVSASGMAGAQGLAPVRSSAEPAVSPSAPPATGLKVIDVGTEGASTGGDSWSWGSVNDEGELGGTMSSNNGSSFAAHWKRGTATSVGTDYGSALGIDDSGELFGFHYQAAADGRELSGGRRRYEVGRQVTISPDVAGNLRRAGGGPGGNPARWGADGRQNVDANVKGSYQAVSPNGTTAGYHCTSSCPGTAFVSAPPSYAYRTIQIDPLDTSVNDMGHVAGSGEFYDGSSVVSTDIDSLVPYGVGEHALNDHDYVVGNLEVGNAATTAAMWHAGKVTRLPDLSSAPAGDAHPESINDSNVVVGKSTTAGAVIWRGGRIQTLDSLLPKGSPWHLTDAWDITNTGYILGTGTLGGKTHYFLTQLSGNSVSGTVYDQHCGEEACSQSRLAGITILVKGKDDNSKAVTKTDVSAKDGTWSVTVPNGRYDAGPSLDGSTFIGPAFDPESLPVDVKNAGVDHQDFTTCELGTSPGSVATGAGSSVSVLGTSAASAHAGVVPHNSSNFSAALCKSQYTIKLSARIPQAQIVDPSPAAPYNRSTDPNTPTFPGQTGKAGSLFYDNGLDSLFETYPKYPACSEMYGNTEKKVEESLETLAEQRIKMRWYSYMSGGSLGSISIPLVFNQSDGEKGTVYFAGPLSETDGSLTRTWVYQFDSDPRYTHKCSEPAQMEPLAVVVPGGNDNRGLVNDNAFTIVVLWYVPFAPPGEVAAPGSSVEVVMRTIVGQQEATHIVETYEHMPWIARFAFTCDLASGGVKAIEGAAAVGKGIKASEEIIKSLESASSIGEKLHIGHAGWDTAHPGYVNIAALLSGDHYPVMGAVIRGQVTTTPNKSNHKLILATSLGLSMVNSHFPDITLHVSRQAKDNQDASCKVTNGPLPWANHPVGCPKVWNPYASLPTDMIAHTTGNLARGDVSVQSIVNDTQPLDTLAKHVRETASVYTDLGAIQSINHLEPPNCDSTDGPQSQKSNTICWVFEDGRP